MHCKLVRSFIRNLQALQKTVVNIPTGLKLLTVVTVFTMAIRKTVQNCCLLQLSLLVTHWFSDPSAHSPGPVGRGGAL